MPSASGVYSLPVGYLAVTGATIQASQHNPPLEDIAAALTARLSRDGSAPMAAPLQLASGTVGAPGATFASDPTSGMYKTTNGLGVAIGGVKVAEFTAAGIASGNRIIGELVPYVCTSTPNSLWVLPFGQTLSRTTYAVLWTQAQIEIAAGNTFFNNGDGSTTFGIGDLRGRLPAAWDKIGGTLANRLTTAGSGVNGAVLGSVGGAETQALTGAQNGPHSHGGVTSGESASHQHNQQMPPAFVSIQQGGASTFFNVWQGSPINALTGAETANHTHIIASDGSGTPHNNTQPSLVTNYILFAGGAS
jgi:microcystin-dependent protein